jgi:hypothetical protein
MNLQFSPIDPKNVSDADPIRAINRLIGCDRFRENFVILSCKLP